MKVVNTKFEGLLLLYPEVFKDTRGLFYESYHEIQYSNFKIPRFVQDNISYSTHGVLRGFHYQIDHPQGQLMWVSQGWAYDVVLDLRKKSTTFGQWFTTELTTDPLVQIYMPPGFAHAFCVLSENCLMHYKCTDFYYKEFEGGVLWNSLDIPWPLSNPIVSEKDQQNKPFSELKESFLPKYEP